MIFKYLNRQKTNTYLNVLQKLVQSYNSTPHRSLNNIAPKDVNDTNSANLWAYLYLAPSQSKSKINDKTQGKKTKTTSSINSERVNLFGYHIRGRSLLVHITNNGLMKCLRYINAFKFKQFLCISSRIY